MKQGTKNELDKIEREERNINIFRIALSFGLLVILFSALFIYRYSPGEYIEITGRIIGLNGVPAPKQGEVLYLVVELESGKIVEARKPKTIAFVKNKRVKLKSTKSSAFGNIRYSFIEYQ